LHPACFGCKIESSGPDFQLYQLLWYPGLEKSSTFGRNIFQLYWLKTLWISPQIMWVCFGCKLSHPGPVFNFTCSSGAWARKSGQNSTKTVFSNIQDKRLELHPKHWGYVSGAKPGHPSPVIILAFPRHALVVPGPRKVFKIGRKHCLAVLMGNDKTTPQKSVSMFRAVNRVIWGLFSTFPVLVVPGPEKSSKLDRNIFRPYWWEMIRIAPQSVSVCFGCKIESSGLDF